MENSWDFDQETAEAAASVATPRFANDAIPKSPNICKAYCINLPDQVRRWKAKHFSQKLDSLILNFVCSLTQVNKEIANELDFRIWFYGLDSDGLVTPSYRDYNRLWLGRRLNTFYLIVTAQPHGSAEVLDCFEAYLQGKRVALNDATHLSDMPDGAFPLYRFCRGKVIEYVERVCLDPALGKTPAYLCPIIHQGWLRFAWLSVDLDKCVRQALASGKPVGRPTETIICNGLPGDFKVELRTWTWSSKWMDAKAKVQENLKMAQREREPKTTGQ
jgi:hypothetical protein